jgi:hypothetical protein
MVGMKKLIVWVFVASLAAFGCYPFAVAQETPAPAAQPSVPSGTYQPFDIWQKVQFGATSVVNPKAAKAAVVVHEYNWGAIAGDKEAEEAILSKAKAGQVSFANETGDGKFKTISSSEVERALTSGESSNLKVLSFDALPGKTSGGKMITWSATKN